jgi:hypothetical protein
MWAGEVTNVSGFAFALSKPPLLSRALVCLEKHGSTTVIIRRMRSLRLRIGSPGGFLEEQRSLTEKAAELRAGLAVFPS